MQLTTNYTTMEICRRKKTVVKFWTPQGGGGGSKNMVGLQQSY